MKPTLAILLLVTTCFAGLDRFERGATNGVVFFSANKAHYELVPEQVPLPDGTIQRVVTMRRMVSSGTTFTNSSFYLSLRSAPPFNVEVSTNLVSWEVYDTSTNSVYNIEVCAQQQVAYPNAFFRAKPTPTLTRVMRGF